MKVKDALARNSRDVWNLKTSTEFADAHPLAFIETDNTDGFYVYELNRCGFESRWCH